MDEEIRPGEGQLVVLNRSFSLASVFTPAGAEDVLAAIRAEVAKVDTDISTPKGRKAVASLAYQIARSKTALDEAGKGLTEQARRQIDTINGERRRIRDELDQLAEDVRRPLTDWENADKARIKAHEDAIAALTMDPLVQAWPASQIGALIEQVPELLAGRDWQEFRQRAERTIAAEIERLKGWYRAALAREEAAEAERKRRDDEAERERIEAARRQAEREAQIAAEAEERARLAAEAKAEEERLQAAAQAQREREDVERRAREEREEVERRLRAEEEARLRAEAAAEAERQAAARRLAEAEAQAQREREEADRRLREAEEQAERDRQAAAQREIEAEERRQREAHDAEQRRIQEAAEAELRQRIAIKAEQERLAAERKREEERAAAAAAEEKAEAERRAANKAHRARINNEILQFLTANGLTADQGRIFITIIAQGKVPHVHIDY